MKDGLGKCVLGDKNVWVNGKGRLNNKRIILINETCLFINEDEESTLPNRVLITMLF